MIVELRSVPDCPNLPGTRELLRACLAEFGLPPTVTELVGDYRSPSVLVDGDDVTGADADGPAVCVLAPPSVDQIRTALLRALPPGQGGIAADATRAPGCPPAGDAIRVDRPLRAAALPDGLREVHRQVLRHFAATGGAPAPAELTRMAADAGLDAVTALRRLAEHDLVAVDAQGVIRAGYPFSPTPTGHVVVVGGVRVWAMCAIDALGVPYMLDVDATITSTDPHTGEPITVTVVAGGVPQFAPATVVVVYGATGGTGGSVDTCCATVNFFASVVGANAWIAAHPQVAVTVLDQRAAVTLARNIFGPLLGRPTDPPFVDASKGGRG